MIPTAESTSNALPSLAFVEFIQIWNDGQDLVAPMVHRRMAQWLDRHWRVGSERLLLLAFRGAGKSTIVGLYCAWLLASRPSLRILVLAADLALARKMVRNVKRIIERHPLTRHLKPTEVDQWAADQFTVSRQTEVRDPSMLARGATSNFTGSRADIVICDDVEVPRTSDTADKRRSLHEKLAEIDFVLVPGGQQLYIGTPHTAMSLYAPADHDSRGNEAPFLADFDRLVIPVIDNHGVSAWPERFTPGRIEQIRLKRGPNKFASQMLLQSVDLEKARIDPARLKSYRADLDYREANQEAVLRLDGRRLVSATCWWDPAFGRPARGDASVVAIVFTSEDGLLWLHDVAYLSHDSTEAATADTGSDEASQLCRQVAAFARRNFAPAVTVETNGIGRFLPSLLRQQLRRAGVMAHVREQASTRSKERRILDAFDPVLSAGWLHAHRSVWETPLISEMRDWRPDVGRSTMQRDDGLDAVAGCLLSEPVRLPRLRRWRQPDVSWQAVR